MTSYAALCAQKMPPRPAPAVASPRERGALVAILYPPEADTSAAPPTATRAVPAVPAEKATTRGLFACPACGSTHTSWSQAQLRSGDEPMTCFVACADCGETWRR